MLVYHYLNTFQLRWWTWVRENSLYLEYNCFLSLQKMIYPGSAASYAPGCRYFVKLSALVVTGDFSENTTDLVTRLSTWACVDLGSRGSNADAIGAGCGWWCLDERMLTRNKRTNCALRQERPNEMMIVGCRFNLLREFADKREFACSQYYVRRTMHFNYRTRTAG